MKRAVGLIASFFYVGYAPWIPGTFGSLAGAVLAWQLNPTLPYLLFFFSILGFCVSAPAEQFFESKDPKQFVMDEVCGMMLSVLWLPHDWRLFAAGFVLFRFFDVLKPWPISRIQSSRSPLSIMWDDLAAGAAVNVILQIATRLL